MKEIPEDILAQLPPWLQQVVTIREKNPYSTASLVLKTHKGSVSKVEGVSAKSYKDASWGNRDYGTFLIKNLNDAVERQYSGALNYTVNLKDGKITQVVQTDHEEHSYLQ